MSFPDGFFPARNYTAFMPEKSLNEIPRALRELHEKGNAALQKQNLDYAIAIFNQILLKEPGFYECREALRATQFKKSGSGGGFFKKMLGTAGSSPQVAKAQFLLRSNPTEAINVLEQALNSDPSNAMVHKTLAEAAVNADFPKTAVLSLEIVMKANPRDQDVARRLAEVYTWAGQINKAESVYTELQKTNPADQEISQALKNLSARRTMREGGYEALEDGKGSYRDILANKEQAISLEQEKREVKSEDVVGRLIAENETRLQSEPNNLKLIRSLAELHAQKKDFNAALAYYQQIVDKEGFTDPSLERAITEANLRKFDFEVSQLDAEAPDHADQLARVQAAKQAFILADCQRRVERYPNDLQIRFEMGQLYFQNGKTSEAIQEFQKAQSNPNRRVQAMGYLGQCFARRGMNDLAARTLQNAIKEKSAFDDEKKELIYNLAAVLEKMGKKEDAIEQLKQIYEVDIGYKDVEKKVHDFYGGS